jgi:hypothetical protein
MESVTQSSLKEAGTAVPVQVAAWRESKAKSNESFNQYLRRILGGMAPILAIVALALFPFMLFFPLVSVVLVVLLLLSGLGIGPYRPSLQTTALMELPPVTGQFQVLIRLMHRGLMYGMDSGVLSVLDGGILFVGERTEFSLTRANSSVEGLYIRSMMGQRQRYLFGQPLDFSLVASAKSGNGVPANRAKQPFLAIRFEVDGFEGSLEMVPLAQTLLESNLQTKELDKLLFHWNEAEATEIWKDTIGPPITAQPGRFRSYVRDLLITYLFLIGVTGGFVAATLGGWSWALPYVALPMVMLGLVTLMLGPMVVLDGMKLRAMEGRGDD